MKIKDIVAMVLLILWSLYFASQWDITNAVTIVCSSLVITYVIERK